MHLKKQTAIWKAAVKNIRLVPEMYTLMRKLNKSNLLFIPYQLRGQKAFKEAYHSVDTSPVTRAILLNAALNPALDINIAMHPYIKNKPSLIDAPLSFTLLGSKQQSFLVPSRPVLEKLSPYVANLQIAKNERANFLQALSTENYTNMKFSLWTHEYKHAWFALIEQLRTTIKANDILKRYYDYEEEDDQDAIDYDRQPTINRYKGERFLRDLNHLKHEFDKFSRLKRILNLDTDKIDIQLEALDGHVHEFLDYQSADFEEHINKQYELFDKFVDIIKDVGDHLIEVDKIKFSDVESQLPKTFYVPQFVHYNLNKAHKFSEKVNKHTLQEEIRKIQNFFISKRGK